MEKDKKKAIKGDLTKYFNTIDFGKDFSTDWSEFERNIYNNNQ